MAVQLNQTNTQANQTPALVVNIENARQAEQSRLNLVGMVDAATDQSVNTTSDQGLISQLSEEITEIEADIMALEQAVAKGDKAKVAQLKDKIANACVSYVGINPKDKKDAQKFASKIKKALNANTKELQKAVASARAAGVQPNELSMLCDSYGARNIKAILAMLESMLTNQQTQSAGAYKDIADSVVAAAASGTAAAKLDSLQGDEYYAAGVANAAGAAASVVTVVAQTGYEKYKAGKIDAVDAQIAQNDKIQDRIGSGKPADRGLASGAADPEDGEVTPQERQNMLGGNADATKNVDINKIKLDEREASVIDNISSNKNGTPEQQEDYKNLKARAERAKGTLETEKGKLASERDSAEGKFRNLPNTIQMVVQSSQNLNNANKEYEKQQYEITRSIEDAVSRGMGSREQADASWGQQAGAAKDKAVDNLYQIGHLTSDYQRA